MSLILALLIIFLTAALLLRFVSSSAGLYLLLLLVLVGGGILGVRADPLAALGLLGLGALWIPRLRWVPRAPRSPRPRPKSKKTTQPTPPPMSAGLGELERDYEILGKVGIGGMATVYKARRRADGLLVALKVPQEKYVGDLRFVRRFHREAEVLSHLSHLGIVKVYDHGNYGETHYIAMEFLDGQGLDAWIEQGQLGVETLVNIMRRVAEALQHIHAQGIIHRDIKPGNIMLLRGAVRPDGSVDPNGIRLMDFGIAAGRVLTRLTVTGARIGTPVYMSPEQAKGQRIDYRSDIYSLGVVFYEALCRQPPFQGGYEAVIHQQIFQIPTPPKQLNPEIPQALSDLIQRMLEKDPEKRPSLEEVIRVLSGGWKEDPGITQPTYLALAVEAKRGILRLIDFQGGLLKMWSGIGGGKGMFPSPPLALAVEPKGALWISLFEFGGPQVRLIHRFSPQGELELSIGPHGMKLGEVLYPVALACSEEALFVLDAETATITRFDLEGTPELRFGGKGPGRGTFDTPRALTIGHHYLYVLDYGNRQVQRFSLQGEYLSRYAFRKSREGQELRVLGGLAVGPDEALYLFDADSQKIRRMSLSGEVEASFPLPLLEGEDVSSLVEIAVHEGILYAARRGSSRIHRISLAGESLEPLEVYAPIRGLAIWHNPEAGSSNPKSLNASRQR